MEPQELTALVTAAANAIYTRCTPEQAALLSILFVQLGTTLATLSALGGDQLAGPGTEASA